MQEGEIDRALYLFHLCRFSPRVQLIVGGWGCWGEDLNVTCVQNPPAVASFLHDKMETPRLVFTTF